MRDDLDILMGGLKGVSSSISSGSPSSFSMPTLASGCTPLPVTGEEVQDAIPTGGASCSPKLEGVVNCR